MLRLCLNPKVLLALGAVGIGILIVDPGLLARSLPLLLLAACPLSMLVMAWGMKRMGGTATTSQVDPQARLADLEAQQAALARQVAQARSEADQQANTRPAVTKTAEEG